MVGFFGKPPSHKTISEQLSCGKGVFAVFDKETEIFERFFFQNFSRNFQKKPARIFKNLIEKSGFAVGQGHGRADGQLSGPQTTEEQASDWTVGTAGVR